MKAITVVICTCVMNFLCDVDSLSVGQTSIYWCSCGGSQRRVECIDVKAQVYWSLFSVRMVIKFNISVQTSITVFLYKLKIEKLRTFLVLSF